MTSFISKKHDKEGAAWQQELIRHNVLSLDFWQDTVTYAGSVMPTGTIGCVVLNIPDETIAQSERAVHDL